MSGRRVSLLLIFLAFGLLGAASTRAHPHAHEVEDALTEGEASEARLAAIAEHLKTEESQQAQCELGSEMGRIAWEIREQLPYASDKTIRKVADLVIGPTHEGKVKCLTGWAASVLQEVGPRAKFAVPALKRALADTEVAEAQGPKPALSELHWQRSLAEDLRSALEAIEGKSK